MRLRLVLLSVVLVSMAMSACSTSPQVQEQDGHSQESNLNLALGRVMLEVSTITWTGCQPRVEASANSVPGVMDVQFDKQSIQKVVITYDREQTSPEAIVEAIENRGDKIAKVVTLN